MAGAGGVGGLGAPAAVGGFGSEEGGVGGLGAAPAGGAGGLGSEEGGAGGFGSEEGGGGGFGTDPAGGAGGAGGVGTEPGFAKPGGFGGTGSLPPGGGGGVWGAGAAGLLPGAGGRLIFMVVLDSSLSMLAARFSGVSIRMVSRLPVGGGSTMRIVSFLTSPILTVSFLPGGTTDPVGGLGKLILTVCLEAGAVGGGVGDGDSGDVWGVSSGIIEKGLSIYVTDIRGCQPQGFRSLAELFLARQESHL